MTAPASRARRRTSRSRSARSALQAVLAGVAQIFFSPRALVGAGFLVAVAIASPLTAALLLLGSAVQTGTGWALKQKDLVPLGLMGYNGALVGAAGALTLGPGVLAVAFTIIGALACAPVHIAIANVFTTRRLAHLGLPVLTIPFCTVAGLHVILLSAWTTVSPIREVDAFLPGIGTGILKGISEVMLTDSILTGILLLAIAAAWSRYAAGFALLGSALAVVWTLVVTGSTALGSTGIPGYSPVLAAIAVGAVFWAERPLLHRVLGAIAAALIALILHPLIAATPVPVFTWPFITGTLVTLAVEARWARVNASDA